MKDLALNIVNVSKRFPGVLALDNVNIAVKKGEIHALCGENGAGKSTLIKIICGLYPYGSYDGDVYVNGDLLKSTCLKDSIKSGIICIQQELSLVDSLSVEENVFMNNLPIKGGIVNWEELYIKTKEVIDRVHLQVNPKTIVGTLGTGQKQLVEIARALASNPRVLLLDEPTASLTDSEVETLLGIVEQLKDDGVTCIYISHKLDEVFRIADSITVIRDGQQIESVAADEITKPELIQKMVGRPLGKQYPKESHTAGDVVMKINNYNLADVSTETLMRAKDISFEIKKGEILGVAGLMGSGRTELFASIFGSYKGKASGEVWIDGEKMERHSPQYSISKGYCMLSEDRKFDGLNLMMSVRENMTLASLKDISKIVINESVEKSIVKEQIQQLLIKTPNDEVKVATLSGGNQQKVIIGKWLLAKPKVLVLDEPTRGVDVGAKFEIYKIINKMVENGIAVVLISSELEEVLGMSDRVMVMNEGVLKGIVDCTELTTQEMIMGMALGTIE